MRIQYSLYEHRAEARYYCYFLYFSPTCKVEQAPKRASGVTYTLLALATASSLSIDRAYSIAPL